jgi:adenine-specific DNA-methyltransferase
LEAAPVERGGAKALGAFYTPAALARRLVRWAVRSPGESVLDPSCGDGVFLREAVRRFGELGGAGEVCGIEVDVHAAAAAARVEGALVLRGSFFEAPAREFDCVVGNPPYIRYQRFREREAVAERLRREGLPASGLASAWAPFALLCSRRLRPGGRLALVIPREALFSNYGREALVHLRRTFDRVEVEPLEPLLFEGALERVALLKCEGPRAAVKEDVEEVLSWRSGELSRRERAAYESALTGGRFVPLSSVADIRLGIVTGDKKFFAPTKDEIRAWRLSTVRAVTSSGHLEGCRLTRADLARLSREGERVALVPRADARYRREGERRGVHRRYKCRIRTLWHELRLGPAPDAFLTYLVHRRPRLAANEAGAWASNNLHVARFRTKGDGAVLCAAFHNPVTRLAIELIGRVYGGGVLKIEPGDARRIPIPRQGPPRSRLPQIDRALREGREPFDWLDAPNLPLLALAGDRLAAARLRPAKAS